MADGRLLLRQLKRLVKVIKLMERGKRKRKEKVEFLYRFEKNKSVLWRSSIRQRTQIRGSQQGIGDESMTESGGIVGDLSEGRERNRSEGQGVQILVVPDSKKLKGKV